MGTNVEIKAKTRDATRQHDLAVQITDQPGQLLEQEDTFFHVRHGMLKLREFGKGKAELIHYQRMETAGPKESNYSIVPVPDPAALKASLSAALDVRGVVRKKRYLYRLGQTRIHVDDVDGLGWFLELEVVMSPGQSLEEGERIAKSIMKKLDIREEDLIDRAYVDLLQGTK